MRRVRALTGSVGALERELAVVAPRLRAERGCGVLTAAKPIGDPAGIARLAIDAEHARNVGSASMSGSSGHTDRQRGGRGSNRQPNRTRY